MNPAPKPQDVDRSESNPCSPDADYVRSIAQEIAELVTLAEVKIGAMLKEIPSSQGKRTDIETFSPVSEEVKPKPKMEVIEELGFPLFFAKVR